MLFALVDSPGSFHATKKPAGGARRSEEEKVFLMADYIAAPDGSRNENNSGPAKDCAEYDRDCACWRCLRHFHLMVADHQFKMLRKYGRRGERIVARFKSREAA